VIRILSTPPSVKAIVSAAGKKIPVLVSPDGVIAGAVFEPAGNAKVFETITGEAMLMLDA
jgi:hypothetical protein